MSYEKQTWNKYDELKTEEENIANGAVVTDNHMNHMESGIGDNDTNLASHLADNNNPHKVTAAQVGLSNVQNFGLATEDEAKQGISNAKYMTPSLTQAVLSANINSIAYANRADGTDGFTTVYPNLNLLNNSRFPGDKLATPWGSYANGGTVVISNGEYNYTTPSTGINKQGGLIYTDSSIMNTQKSYVWSAKVKGSGTIRITYKYTYSDGTNSSWIQGVDTTLTSNYGLARAIIPPQTKAFTKVDITLYFQGTSTGSIKEPKLEEGSTATPYMPSSSEVTTADWPKYVGFSNTVKTNKSASDYTWFPVKDSELTNKVDSHINNKSNSHAVTASQVGAYTKQEIDTKLSKAVMADDSGKVTIKSLQVETVKSNSDTNLLNLSLTGVASATFSYIRINDIVYITAAGNWGNFPDNKQRIVGNIPMGFRPPTDWGTGENSQGGSRLLSAVIKANGDLGITSDAAQNNVYGQFSMSYPAI